MLLLLLQLVACHAAGAATEVHGRIFYPKLDPARPSFAFSSRVEEKDGGRKIVSTYSDLQGKPLATEVVELKGDRLARYSYKQLQVDDFGEATIEGGKVKMMFSEVGKADRDTADEEPDTIVAPMIQPLLARRWDDLMKGDTVHVRYLAIERLDTIGFKFYKKGERTLNGRAVVDVTMKPSSFFLAALVSSIRITLAKDAPHWVVESDGRTPIRQPKHSPPTKRDDWKAIDARVEYDAPVTVK